MNQKRPNRIKRNRFPINKRRRNPFAEKFKALLKKNRIRVFLRWFFYSLFLLIFFMIMSGGFFEKWQPVLIIPLCVAVSVFESEMKSAIFGAVGGLFIDIACNLLFGFSSVWLMPCCLFTTLLILHLIKVNLVNFLWLNASACAIMGFMYYFFHFVLWNVSNSVIVLVEYIIPAYLSAILLSPLIYFAVKAIALGLAPVEKRVDEG